MIPVIIPAYKNTHQLQKCLTHLKNQTVEVDPFVRDNSDDNIYFTAAVNEGIQKAQSLMEGRMASLTGGLGIPGL